MRYHDIVNAQEKEKVMETKETYNQKYDQIEKENKEYLKLFEDSIQNLSKKTIRNHVMNADLFLNDYLLEHELKNMVEGLEEVYFFIDDFFIRKCLWSSPSSVKSTAASIKKFYKCMKDNGKIKEEEYKALCEEIKDNLETWMEDCGDYNDGDFESFYGLPIDL